MFLVSKSNFYKCLFAVELCKIKNKKEAGSQKRIVFYIHYPIKPFQPSLSMDPTDLSIVANRDVSQNKNKNLMRQAVSSGQTVSSGLKLFAKISVQVRRAKRVIIV